MLSYAKCLRYSRTYTRTPLCCTCFFFPTPLFALPYIQHAGSIYLLYARFLTYPAAAFLHFPPWPYRLQCTCEEVWPFASFESWQLRVLRLLSSVNLSRNGCERLDARTCFLCSEPLSRRRLQSLHPTPRPPPVFTCGCQAAWHRQTAVRHGTCRL